ncbi:hypothetical protein HK405_003458 [Cladochytrium tenue]|nr:hypothetical protein HK405_003458 [Cladochytrium tenue]
MDLPPLLAWATDLAASHPPPARIVGDDVTVASSAAAAAVAEAAGERVRAVAIVATATATGRRLVATTLIPRGAAVLRVRGPALLSARNAATSAPALAPVVDFCARLTAADEQVTLAVALIHARNVLRRLAHGSGSAAIAAQKHALPSFLPYVAELPADFAHLPLHALALDDDDDVGDGGGGGGGGEGVGARVRRLLDATPLLDAMDAELFNLRLVHTDVLRPAAALFPGVLCANDEGGAGPAVAEGSTLDRQLWHDLIWAYLAVESRAFRLNVDLQATTPTTTTKTTETGPPGAGTSDEDLDDGERTATLATVLVPAADMANHSDRPNLVTLGLEPSDSGAVLVVTAARDVAAGEELTLCYRDRLPNWMLLCHFGFSVPDNPNDCVLVEFDAADGDLDDGGDDDTGDNNQLDDAHLRREILRAACDIPSQFEVRQRRGGDAGDGSGSPLPAGALAYLRLALADGAELSTLTVSNASARLASPLSARNERAALAAARATAVGLLAAYATAAARDEAALQDDAGVPADGLLFHVLTYLVGQKHILAGLIEWCDARAAELPAEEDEVMEEEEE